MDPIRPIIGPAAGTPAVDRLGAPERMERKREEDREEEERERRRKQARTGRGEVAPPDPPPDDGRPHVDIRI